MYTTMTLDLHSSLARLYAWCKASSGIHLCRDFATKTANSCVGYTSSKSLSLNREWHGNGTRQKLAKTRYYRGNGYL